MAVDVFFTDNSYYKKFEITIKYLETFIKTVAYGLLIIKIIEKLKESIEKELNIYGNVEKIEDIEIPIDSFKNDVVKEIEEIFKQIKNEATGVEKIEDKIKVLIENVVSVCIEVIKTREEEINTIKIGKWEFVDSFFTGLRITELSDAPSIFKNVLGNITIKVFRSLIVFTSFLSEKFYIVGIQNDGEYILNFFLGEKYDFGHEEEIVIKVGKGKKNNVDFVEKSYLIIKHLYKILSIDSSFEDFVKTCFRKAAETFDPLELPYYYIFVENKQNVLPKESENVFISKLVDEIIDEIFDDMLRNIYIINACEKIEGSKVRCFPLYTEKILNANENEEERFDDVLKRFIGEGNDILVLFNPIAFKKCKSVFVVIDNYERYIKAKIDVFSEMKIPKSKSKERKVLKERIEKELKNYFIDKKRYSLYLDRNISYSKYGKFLYRIIFSEIAYEKFKKMLEERQIIELNKEDGK